MVIVVFEIKDDKSTVEIRSYDKIILGYTVSEI